MTDGKIMVVDEPTLQAIGRAEVYEADFSFGAYTTIQDWCRLRGRWVLMTGWLGWSDE